MARCSGEAVAAWEGKAEDQRQGPGAPREAVPGLRPAAAGDQAASWGKTGLSRQLEVSLLNRGDPIPQAVCLGPAWCKKDVVSREFNLHRKPIRKIQSLQKLHLFLVKRVRV